MFVQEAGVDMQALAERLAVSRATLYRVVRTQDRLLGDVLSDLADRTLRLAVEAADGTGVDRIISIGRHFSQDLVAFQPLRRFMRADPQLAIRVLFTPAGGVHERTVAAWRRIFLELQASDGLELPFDADDLAYVFVRIGESLLYADLLAGRKPDIELALQVERALFGS